MKKKIVEIAKTIIGLDKKTRKAQFGGSSAFIGNGKLTSYKDKKDSWILDQMDNGIKKGIPLSKGNDGQWNIDGYTKREKIIAFSIINKVIK